MYNRNGEEGEEVKEGRKRNFTTDDTWLNSYFFDFCDFVVNYSCDYFLRLFLRRKTMKRMAGQVLAVIVLAAVVGCSNPSGPGDPPDPVGGGGDTTPVPTGLTDNTLAIATLTAATDVHWYSFTAASGSTYNIQWDASYQGSGTYTADIDVSAYQENGTAFFTNQSSGYTTPRTISGYSGTVYIKVRPYNAGSSTGTYGIKYYDPSSLPPQTPLTLTATIAPVFHSLGWNSDTFAAGYKLYRDTTPGFVPEGGNLVQMQTGTSYMETGLTAGNSYYYKVVAYNGNGDGSYSNEVNGTTPTPIGLTANTLAIATLTAATDVHWYSFTAASGSTYNIQWDASYQGSGTYTADIDVSAYRENGTAFFTNQSSGYTTPRTISGYSGTVYIKVRPYSASSGYTGTYGIRYYDL